MRTGQQHDRIGRRWYLLPSPRPVRITLFTMSIVDCRVSIIDFSRVDSRFSRVASRVAFRNDVSSQDSRLL
jgi:hypothetical protein